MPKPYEPSRARIRRMTARFRSTWDDRTFQLRSRLPPDQVDKANQWLPPIIPVALVEQVMGCHLDLTDVVD